MDGAKTRSLCMTGIVAVTGFIQCQVGRREGRVEGQVVILSGSTFSADLGGSSE